MPNRSRKPKQRLDLSQLAKRIVDEATGQAERTPAPDAGKDPAAVSLGRKGGLKGGPARAKKLGKKKLSEAAKKAAAARWTAATSAALNATQVQTMLASLAGVANASATVNLLQLAGQALTAALDIRGHLNQIDTQAQASLYSEGWTSGNAVLLRLREISALITAQRQRTAFTARRTAPMLSGQRSSSQARVRGGGKAMLTGQRSNSKFRVRGAFQVIK